LPLPAPARISRGPSVSSTAARCWGLSWSRRLDIRKSRVESRRSKVKPRTQPCAISQITVRRIWLSSDSNVHCTRLRHHLAGEGCDSEGWIQRGSGGSSPQILLALSPLGERVARAGAFISRRGTGEGAETQVGEHNLLDHPESFRKPEVLRIWFFSDLNFL
jgi:hypothetical protein